MKNELEKSETKRQFKEIKLKKIMKLKQLKLHWKHKSETSSVRKEQNQLQKLIKSIEKEIYDLEKDRMNQQDRIKN